VRKPLKPLLYGLGLFALGCVALFILVFVWGAWLIWADLSQVPYGNFIRVLLVLSVFVIGILSLAVGFLLFKNQRLVKKSKVEKHAAMHDPLTGSANRRKFEQRLDEMVSSRSPKHVLMMLDLDRFKPVNDLYGHAAGDALLKDITSGLTRIVSPKDMVARLGGDEFAILLTDTTEKLAEAKALKALEFVVKFRLN